VQAVRGKSLAWWSAEQKIATLASLEHLFNDLGRRKTGDVVFLQHGVAALEVMFIGRTGVLVVSTASLTEKPALCAASENPPAPAKRSQNRPRLIFRASFVALFEVAIPFPDYLPAPRLPRIPTDSGSICRAAV
jgi:hypothetical protein